MPHCIYIYCCPWTPRTLCGRNEVTVNVWTGKKAPSGKGLELVFILLLVALFSTFFFSSPCCFSSFLATKQPFHLSSDFSNELNLSHISMISLHPLTWSLIPSFSHFMPCLIFYFSSMSNVWEADSRVAHLCFPRVCILQVMPVCLQYFPWCFNHWKIHEKAFSVKRNITHTHTHWKYPQRILTQTSCFFFLANIRHQPCLFRAYRSLSWLLNFDCSLISPKPQIQLSILMTIINNLSL